MRRGDYGTDAPAVPTAFVAVAVVAAILTAVGALNVASGLLWLGATNLVAFSLSAAIYLHTTWRGKILVWEQLLDGLGLRGDERALDVGCGRGLVLLLVAERLPRGRAVGIDLWSRADQSGNAEATTRANAAAEGVADRVELLTGDMRALPFEDGSFDLVTSALAIHNLPDAQGRSQALDEILRVLRPGGRALLADLRYVRTQAAQLRARGIEVEPVSLGWRYWYGGPHFPTRLVAFQKPGAP